MPSASRPSRRVNYHKLKGSASRYNQLGMDGYYENRYGKKAPMMLLAWLELGTKERHKRKHRTGAGTDSLGRRYSSKRWRSAAGSTGSVKAHAFMDKTGRDAESSGEVTGAIREAIRKSVVRRAKALGCDVSKALI